MPQNENVGGLDHFCGQAASPSYFCKLRNDPNLIGKRSARTKADQASIAFSFACAGRSMFEESSIFAEMIAVVAVSAIALILILAFYGWG